MTSDPSESSAAASAETSGATTSEATDEGDEDGCFFEHCGDFGTDLSSCDPYVQDCPEGQKCVPYSAPKLDFAGWACADVTGQVPAGEACVVTPSTDVLIDDCDDDSYCHGERPVGEDMVGTCVPSCRGAAEEPLCPRDHSCIDPSLEVPVYCAHDCDPLAQDCGEGSACHWNGAAFECLAEIEALAVGEACGAINDCAAGSICVTAAFEDWPILNCEFDSCCTPYCDRFADVDPCIALDPDYVCTPFFAEGFPAEPDPLGVCVLPGA